MSYEAAPPALPGLRVAKVETIPIRVPLDRVYKGSHYRMTHRSTIVTRVRTASGIGERYAGDEDAGLHDVDDIIDRESAPLVVGEHAFATERLWELARPAAWNILRDRRLGLVARACVGTAVWDAVGKALGIPPHHLWGFYRDSASVITIGGYYAADADIPAEVTAIRGLRRHDRHDVQGRRAEPGRGRATGDAGTAGRRRRRRARGGRESGLITGRGDPVRSAHRRLRHAVVRGAVPVAGSRATGRTTATPCATPGSPARSRLYRSERVLRRRLPRPVRNRIHRLLSLDASWFWGQRSGGGWPAWRGSTTSGWRTTRSHR